jgi:nitrate reductase NapAB chaperone NapD
MKKMTQGKSGVRVNVKFVPGADHTQSLQTVSAMPGVLNVIQTFPDETDQELASLYLVEVENSQIKSALRELRAMPGVEYVEETAPRKLIRNVLYTTASPQ